jgi:hypothetical protein
MIAQGKNPKTANWLLTAACLAIRLSAVLPFGGFLFSVGTCGQEEGFSAITLFSIKKAFASWA